MQIRTLEEQREEVRREHENLLEKEVSYEFIARRISQQLGVLMSRKGLSLSFSRLVGMPLSLAGGLPLCGEISFNKAPHCVLIGGGGWGWMG